jgi:hypothetical protein
VIVRGSVYATVAALLATALLLGIGLMSFHHETAATKPVVLPFDTFWCGSDEDCRIVKRIGCCPCSEGGAQGAVTKWRTDELRLFLKSACRPRPVCIQLDLCRHDVKAICEDNACRLIPDPSRRKASPSAAQAGPSAQARPAHSEDAVP